MSLKVGDLIEWRTTLVDGVMGIRAAGTNYWPCIGDKDRVVGFTFHGGNPMLERFTFLEMKTGLLTHWPVSSEWIKKIDSRHEGPDFVYVKIENGFLGRAYEDINHRVKSWPPGVVYVLYKRV